MPGHITLITGGVKSGKSSHALQVGQALGSRRAFIATATALDDEMSQKIAAHKLERGDAWRTFEEPRDISSVLERAAPQYEVVLIDCLTLWVSNLLTLYSLPDNMIRAEVDQLAEVLVKACCPVILVTNEVGLGIMPPDRLSRQYQNLLGFVNKRISELAGSVFLIISGIGVKIK